MTAIDLTGVTTTSATRNVIALLGKAGLNPHFGPDGSKPFKGAVQLMFDEGGVNGLYGVLYVGARSGKILRASLYSGNGDRHGQRHVGYLSVRRAFSSFLAIKRACRNAARPPSEGAWTLL